jgi:hypothetical protein
MATYYGDQYQDAYVDVPSSAIAPGDVNGVVRMLRGTYTFAANLLANDVIYIGKLPAGAKVVQAHLHVDGDLGDASSLDLGHLANGVDSVNLDAFYDGLATTAAASGLMTAVASHAGIFQEFTVETTVAVDIKANLGTTDSAVGKKVTAAIYYVVN